MTEAAALAAAASPAAMRLRTQVDQLRLFLAHWRGSLGAAAMATVALTIAARELVVPVVALAWCAAICTNYLAQAWVSRMLERAPVLEQAMPRWLPRLVASIGFSSTCWGLTPWIVWQGSAPLVVLAALFNALLLFAVVNAPSTQGMLVAAAFPISLLTTLALLHKGLGWQGLAGAGLFAMILLYGLRVQSAIRATMTERHLARDLAAALSRQQEQLLKLEGERTLLLERQRLMRDLHDGLGSTLTSSLKAIDKGHATPPEIATMLRDCVDDLRIVVDSLEPVDHDVLALLAAVRFRMGSRLQHAGIHLEWDVHDLPPLPWLGPPEALQLMRMVQELLANVAKHSQARRVVVATRATACDIEIRVSDDGLGFDTGAVTSGRGLRFFGQRAQLLSSQLHIESAPGQGTCVRLQLPLARVSS